MTAALITLALMGGHYPGCNTQACIERVQRRAHGQTIKRWKREVAPYNARLDRMARCESGSRWKIATGNGYFGGLQFSLRSWRATGGSGYPHNATELEQKFRAVRLMRLQGWGAWPVCGGS